MKIKLLNLLVEFLITFTILIVRFDGSEEVLKTVMMICYTNEQRSPIAAAVFNNIAKRRGLAARWHSDSAGIAVENRTRIPLRVHEIELNHTTRKLNFSDYEAFDYMLGMDDYSLEYLQSLRYLLSFRKPPVGNKTTIELLSSHDPQKKRPDDRCIDPEYWYQLSYRSCNAFLDKFS